MEAIDYTSTSYMLIIEQLKTQYGPDNTTSDGSIPDQSLVAIVAFPRFSFLSEVVPFMISDISKLQVEWTPGQENKGQLVYGSEFTVFENKIQLTDGTGGTTDWTPTVAANSLGLLNFTITQGN